MDSCGCRAADAGAQQQMRVASRRELTEEAQHRIVNVWNSLPPEIVDSSALLNLWIVRCLALIISFCRCKHVCARVRNAYGQLFIRHILMYHRKCILMVIIQVAWPKTTLGDVTSQNLWLQNYAILWV